MEVDDDGMHTPPPGTFNASEGGMWDDEDQALMEFLLLGNPDGATENIGKQPERRLAHATIEAATKATTAAASKGKLTATEKKARHREVVRRSYHRNKASVKVLKDEVKQLEGQFRALTAGRTLPETGNQALPGQDQSAVLDRIDSLKQQCASLDATSEQLRKDAVKMQTTLLRHQEYARVIDETFDDEMEEHSSSSSNTSDEDDDRHRRLRHRHRHHNHNDHRSTWSTTSASSIPSSPATSMEDVSPMKPSTATLKRALYAIARPTHAVDLFQPAPADRAARKEIGFVPLAPAAAKELIRTTVDGIVHFTLSGKVISTGAHVMGWQDRRLIDDTTVKFSLRKSFPGESASDLMAKTWQCFSDPLCAHQKFRGLMELRILQRVNDDTIIALRDTISPDTRKVYRTVYVLFRMHTRRGFLIGVRSIDDPTVVTDKTKHQFTRDAAAEIQWVDMNGWFVFDRQGYYTDSNNAGMVAETGAEVEYGGMMNYGDATHAVALAMDTLSLVLKWETFMVAPLFCLPPSAE